MTIDRRKLLGAATLGIGAVACGSASESQSGSQPAAPAVSRNRKSLTMVTTWPKGLPGLGDAAERVASEITRLTDGDIEVRVRAAGEHVPAFESFDAVALFPLLPRLLLKKFPKLPSSIFLTAVALKTGY